MAELRIGTCSWKYDSWSGLLYSGVNKINFLEEYATHFNTVEIDQWFWSLFGSDKVVLPDPLVVENYSNSVPADFLFSIKIPNSITLTHYYQKNKNVPLIENPFFLSENLFRQFEYSISQLGDKIGPLMLQFEYLNKNKMPSQDDFQLMLTEFIRNIHSKSNLAIEIRNPNYLNSSYFDFLIKNNLAHVFLQGYYMPSIFDVYKKHRNHIKDSCIIRLHGPDRKGIEAKSGGIWNKIIENRDSEIEQLVVYDSGSIRKGN